MSKQYTRAVTPEEVMALRQGDWLNAEEFIVVINRTLTEEWDGVGWSLDVVFPSDTRKATLQFVARHFRSVGWGVAVRHEENKFTFWQSKKRTVELRKEGINDEQAHAEGSAAEEAQRDGAD